MLREQRFYVGLAGIRLHDYGGLPGRWGQGIWQKYDAKYL